MCGTFKCGDNVSAMINLLQIIRIIGIIIGIGLTAGYIMLAIRAVDALVEGADLEDVWFLLVLSLYGVAFSVMIILIEWRWPSMFDIFNSFRYWIIRGLFYFFQGMLSTSIGVAAASFSDLGGDVFEIFQEIIAYTIMLIGGIYIILGLICCKEVAKNDSQKLKSFPQVV